jgi:hypothetical protein
MPHPCPIPRPQPPARAIAAKAANFFASLLQTASHLHPAPRELPIPPSSRPPRLLPASTRRRTGPCGVQSVGGRREARQYIEAFTNNMYVFTTYELCPKCRIPNPCPIRPIPCPQPPARAIAAKAANFSASLPQPASHLHSPPRELPIPPSSRPPRLLPASTRRRTGPCGVQTVGGRTEARQYTESFTNNMYATVCVYNI